MRLFRGAALVSVLGASGGFAAPNFQLLSPPSSPAARASLGIASVAVGGDTRFFTYGGRLNSGSESGQTWRYSATANTWTLLPSVNPQGNRARGVLAFDPGHRRVVAFGGGQLVSLLFIGVVFTSYNDLAFLDPDTETWSTPTVTGNVPTARADSSLAWASGSGGFYLFGGGQYGLLGLINTRFNDLYRLTITGNTANWTQVTPAGTPPSQRAAACVAYDRVRNRLWVFGGSTSGGEVNDLYAYDPADNRWDPVASTGTPSARAWGQCTYDAEDDKLLLVGGEASNNALGDAYVMDLSTQAWTPISPPTMPSARYASAVAFSDERHASVLFGGITGSGSSSELWNLGLASPPIVNAGVDRSVNEAVAVSLLGTATTDPGKVISVQWTQLSGLPVSLSDPHVLQPAFLTPSVVAAVPLKFRLSVTQGSYTVTDDVTLTVQDTVNEPPIAVANVGPDVPGRLTLDGTASYDPNGEPLTFAWTQELGPSVTLMGVTSSVAEVALPKVNQDTTLRFQLRVDDTRGGFGLAHVNIDVPAAGGRPHVVPIEVILGPPSGTIPPDLNRLPPSFTSMPRRMAPLGQTFEYASVALGTPPLKMSLVSGPAGSSLNTDTGQLKWIPDAEGNAEFVIQAENAFGNAQQHFAVQALSEVGLRPNPLNLAVGCSSANGPGSTWLLAAFVLLGRIATGASWSKWPFVGALSTSRVGQGPRHAVLLHGFLGQSRNLRTLANRWAEADPSRSILLVDLPGHGDSRPLREDEDVSTMAASVAEAAVEAGFADAFAWVGHSQGGRVALAALGVVPQSVASVTLLDISPSPIPVTISESSEVLLSLLRAPASALNRASMRNALLAEGLTPALADWQLLNLETVPEGVAWKIDREALFRFQLRSNPEDLWPVLKKKKVPLFCVAGDGSPYVTPLDADRLRAEGAQVDVVSSGHYVHVEATEPVLSVLSRLPG